MDIASGSTGAGTASRSPQPTASAAGGSATASAGVSGSSGGGGGSGDGGDSGSDSDFGWRNPLEAAGNTVSGAAEELESIGDSLIHPRRSIDSLVEFGEDLRDHPGATLEDAFNDVLDHYAHDKGGGRGLVTAIPVVGILNRVLRLGRGGDDGGDSAPAAPTSGPATNITPTGRHHVVQRHSWMGPESEGKSMFNPGADIDNLIRDADKVDPVTQSNGNLRRTVFGDTTVGWDATVGQFTNAYTVITRPNGNLVTAFPGRP
jgi:hypothetical protein